MSKPGRSLTNAMEVSRLQVAMVRYGDQWMIKVLNTATNSMDEVMTGPYDLILKRKTEIQIFTALTLLGLPEALYEQVMNDVPGTNGPVRSRVSELAIRYGLHSYERPRPKLNSLRYKG